MDINDLKSYLKPPTIYFIRSIISAFAIFVLLVMLVEDESSSPFFCKLILFIMFGVYFWFNFKDCNIWWSFFRIAEQNNTINEILWDFNHSTAFCQGSIYLGDKYIYGEKCLRPFSYSEITQIYECVHKTNGVLDGHGLNIKTVDGHIYTLCYFKLDKTWLHCEKSVGKEEILKIYMTVLMKNKFVKIGYKY